VPGSIAEPVLVLVVGLNHCRSAVRIWINFQVNFLLNATQASQTTTTLTAPRVTLL